MSVYDFGNMTPTYNLSDIYESPMGIYAVILTVVALVIILWWLLKSN
jgi:uncharacterized membrane-anchored protein